MIIESFSNEETFSLGYEIGSKAKPKEVYCLSGDLGVGKTVFAKGFAKGLGIEEHITSPTFTLVNEYNGRLKLCHFDIYRLEDSCEIYDLGFDEYIYGDEVCLIEWGELILDILPKETVYINIYKDYEKGDDYRRIEIKGGSIL